MKYVFTKSVKIEGRVFPEGFTMSMAEGVLTDARGDEILEIPNVTFHTMKFDGTIEVTTTDVAASTKAYLIS